MNDLYDQDKKINLFKGGLHVRQLDETLEHEIAQV